jgi:membrane protease subunit (stomatin/prohibitin family)
LTRSSSIHGVFSAAKRTGLRMGMGMGMGMGMVMGKTEIF